VQNCFVLHRHVRGAQAADLRKCNGPMNMRTGLSADDAPLAVQYSPSLLPFRRDCRAKRAIGWFLSSFQRTYAVKRERS
jgi:hypothetical protein